MFCHFVKTGFPLQSSLALSLSLVRTNALINSNWGKSRIQKANVSIHEFRKRSDLPSKGPKHGQVGLFFLQRQSFHLVKACSTPFKYRREMIFFTSSRWRNKRDRPDFRAHCTVQNRASSKMRKEVQFSDLCSVIVSPHGCSAQLGCCFLHAQTETKKSFHIELFPTLVHWASL